MRTPTFVVQLLLLAFSAALVQPKALAWSCEGICAVHQNDCLSWKKNHCPTDVGNPFLNRFYPSQLWPPTPARVTQGCCVFDASCSAPKRACAPASDANPVDRGVVDPLHRTFPLMGEPLSEPDQSFPSAGAEPPTEPEPAPAPPPVPAPRPVPEPVRGLDDSPPIRREPEQGPNPKGFQGQTRPEVRASRAFSGPGQFPPREFAAYGIVAFQSLPSDAKEAARYGNICRGYLAAIPAAITLRQEGIPLKEQMVTVWPLTDKKLASALNTAITANDASCDKIVASTNLLASHDAIHKANKLPRKPALKGRGPYLIAWSPATAFGTSEAAVLVLDLSNITTSEGAVAIFQDWADKIEKNPQLWKGGWNLNSLRLSLRFWADRWGTGVLAILSPTTK